MQIDQIRIMNFSSSHSSTIMVEEEKQEQQDMNNHSYCAASLLLKTPPNNTPPPTQAAFTTKATTAYGDTRFIRLNDSSATGKLSIQSHKSDLNINDDFHSTNNKKYENTMLNTKAANEAEEKEQFLFSDYECALKTSTSPSATMSIASLSLQHQEGQNNCYDDKHQADGESKVADISLRQKVFVMESSFSCFSPPSIHQEQEMPQQHHHISESDLMKPPTSPKYLADNLNLEQQQQQLQNDSPSSVVSTPNMRPASNNPLPPVLYSAINSLENASANSFGKVRSKYRKLSGRRDFQSHRLEALIPPKSTVSTALFSKMTSCSASSEKQTADPVTLCSDKVLATQPLKASNADADEAKKLAAAEVTAGTTKTRMRKASSLNHLTSIYNSDNNEGAADESNQINLSDETFKKTRLARRRRRRRAKPVELFRPSCDAYTPRIGDGYPTTGKDIKFKPAETRTSLTSSSMGTLSRPNFRDALRRVAMILQQHVVKIERRFEVNAGTHTKNSGLFKASMMELFSQYNFCNPTYKCAMVRLPMARPGMIYGLREIQTNYDEIPTEQEIYEFGHRLFQKVQLSSECSIVCLIYVERLMEIAKVPVVARTWRPIFMCGLLLASKVWQDLSSWNIEFASVYPQFSLDQINRLELLFLKNINWDLYISSSLYAKYYFALRSLLEKQDFRNRYNRMILGHPSAAENNQALKVQQRSEQIKEEALLQLSRSM